MSSGVLLRNQRCHKQHIPLTDQDLARAFLSAIHRRPVIDQDLARAYLSAVQRLSVTRLVLLHVISPALSFPYLHHRRHRLSSWLQLMLNIMTRYLHLYSVLSRCLKRCFHMRCALRGVASASYRSPRAWQAITSTSRSFYMNIWSTTLEPVSAPVLCATAKYKITLCCYYFS